MNQSFQSPHPEVGMVSLLYDSATEQLTVFVQNFKSYYILLRYVDMKKDLDDSRNWHAQFQHSTTCV